MKKTIIILSILIDWVANQAPPPKARDNVDGPNELQEAKIGEVMVLKRNIGLPAYLNSTKQTFVI